MEGNTATQIVTFPKAQPAAQRVSNRPAVKHKTAKRESAVLINVLRKAVNISKYDNNNDEDYSTSNYKFSASKDGMPNLRINYENTNSNNSSDDESVSTGRYEYESDSNNKLDSSDDESYVDEFSDSDDERDQIPDLCMNLDNNSSIDNSDAKTVLAGEYDYESASNNKLDSSNDKSIGNDNRWHGKQEHRILKQ